MANYTEKPKRKGPKKKSIKAPIHSRMDPKRKISRMGKKRQKHKGGLDAVFVSQKYMNFVNSLFYFVLFDFFEEDISASE